MKRLLSLLLVLVVFMCSTGAFAELPDYINTESALPIVKEGNDITLSLLLKQEANWGNAEDVWFWKYAEDVMNIHFDITQSMEISTYLPLLFAGGELPDIIMGAGFTPDMLVQYGDLEQQLVDIAPYVTEEYMPNFYKLTQQYPFILENAATPDGKLYSLPYIADAESKGDACFSCCRFFINEAWLEKIGMKNPETLDEFLEALRKFKTLGDGIIPFGGSMNYYNKPSTLILIALGYLTDDGWGVTPCLRDGKVVIPAADREVFGEYLKIMNTMYAEGLIDPDYYTMDSAACDSKMAQDLNGVYPQVAYLTHPDTFADWTHVQPLTSEWNDKKQWPSTSMNLDSKAQNLNIGGFVVTSNCEDIATALRFADWFYEETSSNYVLSVVGPDVEMVNAGYGYGVTEGWEYVNEAHTTIAYREDGLDQKIQYQSQCGRMMGMHSARGCGNGLYYPLAWQLISGDVSDVSDLTYTFDPTNGDSHYRMKSVEVVRQYLTATFPKIAYFDPETAQKINDIKVLICQEWRSQESKTDVRWFRALRASERYGHTVWKRYKFLFSKLGRRHICMDRMRWIWRSKLSKPRWKQACR